MDPQLRNLLCVVNLLRKSPLLRCFSFRIPKQRQNKFCAWFGNAGPSKSSGQLRKSSILQGYLSMRSGGFVDEPLHDAFVCVDDASGEGNRGMITCKRALHRRLFGGSAGEYHCMLGAL